MLWNPSLTYLEKKMPEKTELEARNAELRERVAKLEEKHLRKNIIIIFIA